MRRELRQSDSIEIIILNNYRSIVIPECGQISPGLQNDVDGETNTDHDIVNTKVHDYSHSEFFFF